MIDIEQVEVEVGAAATFDLETTCVTRAKRKGSSKG